MPRLTSFLASDFKNLNCFIFVWNVFVACRLLCDLLDISESLWQTWHVCVCVHVCAWWCMCTEPKPPFMSLRLIFMLCSHLCLGLPVNLFPSLFKLCLLSHHFHACSLPTNLIFDLITLIIFGEALCCPVVSSVLLLTFGSKYYLSNHVCEHPQTEKLRNL